MKKVIGIALVSAVVASAAIVLAAAKHPNIVAAQVDLGHAWDKIVAAQKANEFDLGGHAQKAKDAIEVANKELKLAAEAAK